MKSSFEKTFKKHERKSIFWNEIALYICTEIEICRIKINKKECSRSVPMRNVPLHREEIAQDRLNRQETHQTKQGTGWTWTSHPNQGHESRLFQRHSMSPQFNCMSAVRPIVSNYHALFIIIHYTDIISYINHYKSPCWLVDSPNSQQFSTSLVSGHSLRFSASQISPQSLCSAPFGSQTDM